MFENGLKDKKVIVAGAGKSGIASVGLLLRNGANAILYDGNTAPFETTFSIDGKKLNIKDSFGNDTIYTKK